METRKTRKTALCNKAIVFHFCKKVRKITAINCENLCDDRKFWIVVKPFSCNKIVSNEKMTLVEGGRNYQN